ncbi:MAG TPA: MarR family transcriptional regulator [Burkholderiales bacterium]|jgi:DNA-binding MarR family transcriptional regulator|nr:MarR family transcriptional regulator [Burkholderiales bacterium]
MPSPGFDAQRSQDSLGYLIGNLRRALLEEMDKAFAPHGINATQAIVLFQIANGVARHAAEFCRMLRYDPGAMTRLLDRLEAKGFARRVRSAKNRRNVRIELTPAGRAALPHLGTAAFAVFDVFLRGFTKAETRQLFGYLKRMLANAP